MNVLIVVAVFVGWPQEMRFEQPMTAQACAAAVERLTPRGRWAKSFARFEARCAVHSERSVPE